MWGRERVKVEESVGKLAKNALFSNFSSNSYNQGKFLVENMQLKASQPFRDHLDIFPSKALENDIFLLFSPNFPPAPP